MTNPSPTGQDSLYTIVKGRFKAVDTNTFGLILIFLNNNLKVAENISVISSHFSSMYETDPKGSWADVEERIFSLKWKGEFATNITRDIQNHMDSTLREDLTSELFLYIQKKNISKIENLLFTLLTKPLGEKNIHIELSWENVTAQQIQEVKAERESRDAEISSFEQQTEHEQSADAAEFDLEEGSVVLDVDLILAPVSGIPIFELQAGDKIMVKINPATNRGRYFIDLLNAMHEGEVVPIPATVKEVKINQFNEYAIMIKIGEGIFGKTTETEQVKLKRYNPENDKRAMQQNAKNLAAAGFGKNAQPTKEDKAISNLYWLMYLGGFIIVVALLFIVLNVI